MCLFCQIVERTLPARIIHEDEWSIAFEDIRPQAPVHLLIIPKKHIVSVDSLADTDASVIGHLFLVARDLAKARKVEKSGFRLVLNTGPDAGQSVFHIHLHLVGGRQMSWPPG
jgi:histidine triad (HIT) family protein